MDATATTGSTERHLELFEVVVLDALLELAEEEVVGDEVLLGKAGGVDGLDGGEVIEVAIPAFSLDSPQARRVLN